MDDKISVNETNNRRNESVLNFLSYNMTGADIYKCQFVKTSEVSLVTDAMEVNFRHQA